MDKTLFLVDLSLQTISKLNALAEQAEGTEVYVCQGQIGDLSVNTNLKDEQIEAYQRHINFKFIDFKEIRKHFLEFEKKFIVAGNDVFTQTAVEELNLMGRKDVGVLNFGPDRTPEQAYEMAQTAMQMCRQAIGTLSDIKLQLAALVETLTDEQKAKYNETLTKTKTAVHQTLAIQKDFIVYLSKVQTAKTIEQAVEEYCKEHNLEQIIPGVLQNYEKISGINDTKAFEEHIDTKFNGTELCKNESLLHAFLMTYTSAVSVHPDEDDSDKENQEAMSQEQQEEN